MTESKINDTNLTDQQYYDLLLKIKERVHEKDFYPTSFDCTDQGAKDTGSNCGLCNSEEWTTFENSLFPDDFLAYDRKSLKYCKSNHKCPFDKRKKPGMLGFSGCFYTCYLFQGKGVRDIDEMKKMVDKTIEHCKKVILKI